MFEGIPGSAGWLSVTPLDRGFSADRKYRVLQGNGTPGLLRLCDIHLADRKKKQFDMLQRVANMGLNVPRPLAFGETAKGDVYMLLSWLEGEEAQLALPQRTSWEQYDLGIDAGRTLCARSTRCRSRPAPRPGGSSSWPIRSRSSGRSVPCGWISPPGTW